MRIICHICGAEVMDTKQHDNESENGASELNSLVPIGCCTQCREKLEHASLKHDHLSPSISFSSSGSFASSCSDMSVDMTAYIRNNGEQGTSRNLQNSAKVEHAHHVSADLARDVEITSTDDCQEQRVAPEIVDSSIGEEDLEIDASHALHNEFDAQIWEPPEPEDLDDDLEGSVANIDDDDDDECGDGTNWGKPIALSRFGEEGTGSFSFKEEKQRAMEEVMNGKFRALVGQLLKSVGLALTEENSDSWIDVVTSLSWEAASFVKPDATEGKAMDPDGYLKVKCIASGSLCESQLIKGLVFKKHAAHKHMPTKYKNPRLLLVQGMLGQSSSGLSSLKLMEQERSNLNSVVEMIELCQPNVVLVEKSVSRDVQEYVLKKGMTLVFDMKLHRLERVCRCTGSPILSTGVLSSQKLKQCDEFRFEKYIEEHSAFVEGGKKPSKTLMFLEGCPTRLGCTILLKGSHIDELKKIKCVVLCAFVMAYHLILETSFLADQRAMFCTMPLVGVQNVLPVGPQTSLFGPVTSSVSTPKDSTGKVTPLSTLNIPISGSEDSNSAKDGDSVLLHESYNTDIFSGVSSVSAQASIKKVLGNSFSRSSTPYQSLSSYFGLNGTEQDGENSNSIPVLTSPEELLHPDVTEKCNSDEEKNTDSELVISSCPVNCGSPKGIVNGASNEEPVPYKDDVCSVLDSQSILVLMSSRNASRGIVCEQIHFSHIKFYKNFDIPLGKFLRNNLLNQRHQCTNCSEPPEAHFYYYAHHKKQLTVQVKQLLQEKRLPGEAEGKLWMWSCCGKCKPASKLSKSTKRVLMSTATQGLSFGKFLEMSFDSGYSFKASSCGHSLEKDFLYFFGSGVMVAMFRYSQLVTYSVSVPPRMLELASSTRDTWLDEEIEHVYKKGSLLFKEVKSYLQNIGSQFGASNQKFDGLKGFADIENLLDHESSDFEVKIQTIKTDNATKHVYKLLVLNHLRWELLLASKVWDRRLHFLSSNSAIGEISSMDKARQGHYNLEEDIASLINDRTTKDFDFVDDDVEVKVNLKKPSQENDFSFKEVPIEGPFQGLGGQGNLLSSSSDKIQGIEGAEKDNLSPTDTSVRDGVFSQSQSAVENSGGFPYMSGDFGADRSVSCLHISSSQKDGSFSLLSKIDNSKEHVWKPVPEIWRDYPKDTQKGYMFKFAPISRHSELLPSMHQLISEEGSRLHINFSAGNFMVTDFDDELSSIIACALTLSKNSLFLTKDLNGDDNSSEKGVSPGTTEGSNGIFRSASMASPRTSSGLLDSDGRHLSSAFSLDDSRYSSFDGFNFLSSPVSLGAIHPEVSLGAGKLSGKGKYSVVSFYADQFRDLRIRCCPCELDYIASLSRCKNWDAKGGKSKSFFAKTMDDRFIIKEIKRTEFDSFMKFAQDYFNHMNHSFESGNQTCLAKILGIYQVKLMKGGKEVKHDLMVMENLTFGRNVTRQYDLKGALHARFNSVADGTEDVLLDQNFVNDMNASPLYVSNTAKRVLQRAVWNDTRFLNSINVMDYSLLVVVDSQRHELVCGIIDFLRQYTWDKQLETWVKSSLVVPKNVLPTVISPVEYKKRFRKFMSTHFLSVPDQWCSETSDPSRHCNEQKQ